MYWEWTTSSSSIQRWVDRWIKSSVILDRRGLLFMGRRWLPSNHWPSGETWSIKCEPVTSKWYNYLLQNCLGDQLSLFLVNLTNLRHLNWSWNNFSGIQVPTFLGLLKNLRYLNLANAVFDGEIPHHLGNLSCLWHLELGGVTPSLIIIIKNIGSNFCKIFNLFGDFLQETSMLIELQKRGSKLIYVAT